MALTRVPRRPVVVGLVVVGVLAVGFVAAALTNPWRLTGLYPLATQGGSITVLVLAGVLFAAAVLTHLGTSRRALMALVAALFAIPAVCVGLPVVAFSHAFRHETQGEVLAVSPDGTISAVKSTLDSPNGPRTRIYLRSRAGLLSRESATPAAECPYDPFTRGVPPEGVRFTAADALAIPLADRPTTVVRFNAAALAPDRTVMMCDATT